MAQAPEVLAMIVCDLVITDVESNKKSLIGLFDHVEAATIPCALPQLHVYASLTDGHGPMSIAIACVPADRPGELFRGEADVTFPDPLQVVELHFVFPHAQFPRAGEYRFQLLADGRLLRERKFFVTHVAPQHEGQEC